MRRYLWRRPAFQTTPIMTRSRSHSTAVSTPEQGPQTWRTLEVPDRCLRLTLTLYMGQAFRWLETGTHDFGLSHTGRVREWAGVIGQRLYVLRQADPEPPLHAPDPVWYRTVPSSSEHEEDYARIVDYFRADQDYTTLFKKFRSADAVFDRMFPYFRGVRTIRHCPVECLFAYICSSNNHMKRIASMVTHLARHYGTFIDSYGGHDFHSFPSPETLSTRATEPALREAGFGYRAKFIVDTAKMLVEMARTERMTAEELLLSWRELNRAEVATTLVQFPGVGRKVAGCIALMSLDQLGEIPVDTHVWQMGTRYLPELQTKKLTKKTYDAIGDCFRAKFGEHTCGLAHNILFAGELSEFKGLVPGGVPEAMWAQKTEMKEETFVVVKEEVELSKET